MLQFLGRIVYFRAQSTGLAEDTAPSVQPTETGVGMPFHSRVPLSMAGQVIHCDRQHKLEFVNLTELVEKQIAQSGICEGVAVGHSLHSTTAIFLNERQDALLEDSRILLEESVRPEGPWRHNDQRYSDCDRSQCRLSSAGLAFGGQCNAERVRREVTPRPMAEHYSGGAWMARRGAPSRCRCTAQKWQPSVRLRFRMQPKMRLQPVPQRPPILCRRFHYHFADLEMLQPSHQMYNLVLGRAELALVVSGLSLPFPATTTASIFL
jgi:hypothetical protein